MIDLALDSDNPWLEGIDRERLEREQVRMNFRHLRPSLGDQAAELSRAVESAVPFEPFLPFAHGGFRTPTGKAELYSEDLKAQGLDPVVEFPLLPNRDMRSERISAGTAGPQGGQLPQYDFLQRAVGAGMEEAGLLEITAADARRGALPTATGCGSSITVEILNSRAGGWSGAGGSRFCDSQLGQDGARISEHQQLNFRKTYRHGQLRHVLFRLG